MNSAPGLPTDLDYADEYDAVSDPYSSALNFQLNQYVEQIPTTPPMQRAPSAIWQYQDVGVNPEEIYNVGYHQVPVGNQVTVIHHYESPEVPVTQLPFKQALYNSTLAIEQAGGQTLYNYRAPGINEGA